MSARLVLVGRVARMRRDLSHLWAITRGVEVRVETAIREESAGLMARHAPPITLCYEVADERFLAFGRFFLLEGLGYALPRDSITEMKTVLFDSLIS